MPKYYVKSNQLRVVIDAESPRFAALESLDVISRTPTTDSLSLGHHFEVGLSDVFSWFVIHRYPVVFKLAC